MSIQCKSDKEALLLFRLHLVRGEGRRKRRGWKAVAADDQLIPASRKSKTEEEHEGRDGPFAYTLRKFSVIYGEKRESEGGMK
jgi:hypothetical protein